MSKKYKKRNKIAALPAPVQTALAYLVPAAAAFVYFMAVRLNTPGAGKGLAVCCILLAFAVGAVNFRRLRDRISLPFIALAVLVLINGISAFYAVSGKFALREFLRLVVSFCLGIGILSLVKGEGEKPGRAAAAVLERCVALSGLISIDYISTRIISTPFLKLLGLFTSEYEELAGLEKGTRMISISGNANVFAGYIGIGVLLSVGLVLSSENGRERVGHLVCLFINAFSFVLAFSMGASAMIVLGFLAYFLLERRDRRIGLFLLMVETLTIVGAAAAVTAMTSFDAWDGSLRPVPLLCVAAGAGALCCLDRYVGCKITEKLAGKEKKAFLLIGVILAAILVFALVAVNLTGGTEIAPGDKLERSVYLAPGEYVLDVGVTSGAPTVRITSQNRTESMMHTEEIIHRGYLAGAAFTVPEGSQVVHFIIYGKAEGTTLEYVRYKSVSGNETGKVPLEYKLLPGFIANRIQGLRSNENAIQRIVFFEDGIKLFKRAPVFGLGIGAFESAIMSVQSFFYETKYAHNHYIQALAETGVVGFAAFVGLLVICGAAVLAARKKEDAHPLVPALGAALVFMAGHGFVEVVFSAFDYIPVAFGVFTLIGLCCGEALKKPALNKRAKTVTVGMCAALLAVFFVFLYNNMAARQIVRSVTFENLERAAEMDEFEWADYATSYMVSAQSDEVDEEIRAKADKYALRLEKVSSNTIPIYLAEYYFETERPEQGFAMIEKYVSYVASKPATWTTAFDVLEHYWDGTEEYREGVLRIYQMLQEWDEANIGTIELGKDTLSFIERMGG